MVSRANRTAPPGPRIYRYIVKHDGGVAPNPFGRWCTLAICKPRIRHGARKGDWIIGLRKGRNDHVIYVMQVQDVMTFAEYWDDARFVSRRPGRTVYPDNIYRPDGAGSLTQVRNHVHGVEDVKRDLSGEKVLASQKFWYFGDQSPPLPTDLIHLVHSTQGHVVHKNRRPGDVERVEEWLSYWKPGRIGKPGNAERSAKSSAGCGSGCGAHIARPKC